MSVGANDIKFADVAERLAIPLSGFDKKADIPRDRLGGMTLEQIGVYLWGAEHESYLDYRDLDRALNELDAGLGGGILDPSDVYITEYYDPTSSGVDAASTTPPSTTSRQALGVSEAEARWARRNVLEPLNARNRTRGRRLRLDLRRRHPRRLRGPWLRGGRESQMDPHGVRVPRHPGSPPQRRDRDLHRSLQGR